MEHVTAQVLGQYRRDLIAEGFGADIAERMAADAARIIVDSEGLALAADEASA